MLLRVLVQTTLNFFREHVNLIFIVSFNPHLLLLMTSLLNLDKIYLKIMLILLLSLYDFALTFFNFLLIFFHHDNHHQTLHIIHLINYFLKTFFCGKCCNIYFIIQILVNFSLIIIIIVYMQVVKNGQRGDFMKEI